MASKVATLSALFSVETAPFKCGAMTIITKIDVKQAPTN